MLSRRLAWLLTQTLTYDIGPALSSGGSVMDRCGSLRAPDISVEPFVPLGPVPSSRPYPLDVRPLSGKPVLTGRDVNDHGTVNFVADPFLWPADDGGWHMFFEVYSPSTSPPGAIAHATSPDGREWEYGQVVLTGDSHLSFPFLFKYDGEVYMIPQEERYDSPTQAVNLYRAEEFPRSWTRERTLVSVDHYNDDAVLFRHDGRWWVLVGDSHGTDGLFAYYSDDVRSSSWSSHQANPVVSNRSSAGRLAGRPLVYEDRVLAFYQDCSEVYGQRVRAFEITALSPEVYADSELAASPILGPGPGSLAWNSGRMHHIDPWWVGDRWICAVDGAVSERFPATPWSISIYVSG